MRNFNLCSAGDSYKFLHWKMLIKGLGLSYGYFESRKGAMFPFTQFSTLQFFINEYLLPGFTEADMLKAEARVNAHLGPDSFYREGWQYILDNYGGKLPLKIMAVQEGTNVPTGNVLFTIESTDDNCGWLEGYVETILTHIWAGSTIATLSRTVKTMLEGYLEETSDRPEAIAFMLHDFGFRGVSSFQSAAAGGMGHIQNFMGTDTFAAVDAVLDYYNTVNMPAFSVPASEHSIMTAEGRAGEMNVVGRLLSKFPVGILSLVIDSFNDEEFVRNTSKLYKDIILNREDILAPDGSILAPGKTVFRPDSGPPVETSLKIFRLLEEEFGSTVNSKGFKVLNPKVGILWGDGIGMDGIKAILEAFKENKIAACNIVFGMGGGLLQKINRDNQRFAFKCSYQEQDGKGVDIFKDPIDSSKRSKAGRFALIINDEGKYETIQLEALGDRKNLLETVFENGVLVRNMTFEEVRANADILPKL